jgi:hypothetical protein
VTSDCKWEANTKNIVKKGNGRLWFLRRLKTLVASLDTLVDISRLFCRSILEYAAPVWSGSLTNGNKQDIKRVQKNAMRIIFGSSFSSYDDCLEDIEEDTLLSRRDKLCLSFAENCLKDEKFANWFPKGVSTRSGCHYFEIDAKTKRFGNSALPHLTRLLNNKAKQK